MLSLYKNVSHETILTGVIGLVATYLFYLAGFSIYYYFFSPLTKFPGPRLRAISHWPGRISAWRGTTVLELKAMHDKYGPIVRANPTELSFLRAPAWRDINGHRTGGKKSFQKDPQFYRLPVNNVNSIITADDENHARIRRILSHSFSDKALKDQEPLFKSWSDKLIEKLNECIVNSPSKPVDMVKYWNCTTFDIMGDLTFAEPLYMLDNGEYSPWVQTIFSSIKFAHRLRVIQSLPLMDGLIKYMMPDSMRRNQVDHFNFSKERVNRRLAKQEPRADLWSEVLRRKEKEGLSLGEMHSNGALFMFAGTETTATLLSGLTYLLLQNPDTMTKLVSEIRDAFVHRDDLSIEVMQRLPYLNACIEEGLRMYPPVPIGLPRLTPKGGSAVDGVFVPEGTLVSIAQYSAYHSGTNFAEPDSFIPERWLGHDARFANDKKTVFQPFSHGPRNCIGKNLAYHEARLLLCEVLWNFDLELDASSRTWIEQDAWVLWEKQPLWVKLKVKGGVKS